MFQKQSPKMVKEPENKESYTSDKQRKDSKKPEPKSSKHEDSCAHPQFDYESYKRRPTAPDRT